MTSKFEAAAMGFLAGVVLITLLCMAAGAFNSEPPDQQVVITLADWYITATGRTMYYLEYMIGGEMQPTVTCSSEEYLERLVKYMEREFGAIRLEGSE